MLRSGPPVFVITAPSGSGKNTIIDSLLKTRDDLVYSISSTTRAPRKTEKHGVHYWFLSKEDFQKMIQAGGFIEYAAVLDNFYGTSRAEIDRILKQKKYPILDIDVQGATQLLNLDMNIISVFIAPPSLEELHRRLVCRGTETKEQIERRIALAREELNQKNLFSHIIVNDLLDEAVAEIHSLIDHEIKLYKEDSPSAKPE